MNLLSETQSFTFLLAMLQNLFYSFVVVVTVVSKSCLTFCDPLRCTLQGSSVHGSSQAGILEWVAMPASRGSPQLRDWTQVSHTAARFVTLWATRETQLTVFICWDSPVSIYFFLISSLHKSAWKPKYHCCRILSKFENKEKLDLIWYVTSI